jgi:hypothetical protein
MSIDKMCDYDRFHALVGQMYGGIAITSSGRKVPKAERVTTK